jgi:hypothetical protein
VEVPVPCISTLLKPCTIDLEVPLTNASWALKGVRGGLKAGGGPVACGMSWGAGGVVSLEGPSLIGLGVVLDLPLLGSGPDFLLTSLEIGHWCYFSALCDANFCLHDLHC